MSKKFVTWNREQSVRLLNCGSRLFLTAALAASQTPGEYAPFALGCIAAAGGGAEGAAALAGGFLGAVLFLRFRAALPHLAAGILLYTTSVCLWGWKKPSRRLRSITAAGIFLAVYLAYVLQSLSPGEKLMPCLAAAALTGASAWFFTGLLQPGRIEEELPGVLFLAAALLLGLADVEIRGCSVGRALLCTLLAYTAYDRGPLTGAAAGLSLGLTADLCGGSGGGIFTAGLGLAGLLCGSRWETRRIWAALAFSLAAGAVLLPAREPLTQPLLWESLAGAVLFLLLPGRLFGGKRLRKEPPPENRMRWKQQLDRAAAAMRELYDSMNRLPQPAEENPAIVFDRAAEQVCRGCALCDLCWQKEYNSTFTALNDATGYLMERGRAMPKDFHSYFSSRCIHLTDFIAAVNRELSAFLLRRQYRRQLEETRRSAKGQYAQMSDLLTATAAGLETAPVSAFGADCRIGAALRPKEGERVCGDTLSAFRTDSGVWYLLLADGMGSGAEAQRESALTCRLLRQFLEAGIAPEAALKTLNEAMALRGAETGSFTTIDLCAYHPADNGAVFYKFGASPSYLKKGGAVRRIAGGSFPAGLRGAPAEVTRTPLDPGTFIVQISDGVADPGRDDWVQNLLAGWSGQNPQILANLLLDESARQGRLQDDCGIQVLYCPERQEKEA